MKSLFRLTRIKSLLIMMVSFVSLLFFTCSFYGCSISEDVIIKVIYKPYASESVPGILNFGKYSDYIYKNLVEESEDILTRMVARYGLGDVGLKDNSNVAIKPKINTDFNSLFATSGINESEKEGYASDISKFTQVYLNTSNKILILSNVSPKASLLSSILTITNSGSSVTYKALVKFKNLTRGGEVSANTQLDNNCVYRYENGNTLAFVFVGGYIGNNSGTNNFSNTSNALTYIKKFFNNDYNAIQKNYVSETLNDDVDKDLKFNAWNYSLTQSKFDSCNSDPEDFLDEYLKAYTLSMATELAKNILLRYEGTEFPSELNSIYNSALAETERVKAGDYEDKDRKKFIEACCEYIDHVGFLLDEKEIILKSLFGKVIGSTLITATDISDVDFKDAIENNKESIESADVNKFISNSWFIINETYSSFPCKPILEYKTFKKSPVDDYKVNGYIQSIVFMSKDSFKVSAGLLNFKNKMDKDIDFKITIRGYIDGVFVKPSLLSIDKEDLKNETISFSTDFKVNDCDDNLKGDSTINDDTYNLFSFNSVIYKDANQSIEQENKNELQGGFGWCFNDTMNDFVEIVFGSPNIFNLNEIDIVGLSF